MAGQKQWSIGPAAQQALGFAEIGNLCGSLALCG